MTCETLIIDLYSNNYRYLIVKYKMSIPIIRTPISCFEKIPLPGWVFGRPTYFTSQLFGSSIQMAYWIVEPHKGDNTTKETILLTHGQPTWSYLNRRLVQPLVNEGHRVVMFDQVGFGWSDKPIDIKDYTYQRHVAWNEDLLINHLNLDNVTAVFQDWGGLIGLRVAARNPSRFSRLVLANTILPTSCTDFEGINYISKGFYDWKAFSYDKKLAKPDQIGKLLGRGASGPSVDGGRLSTDEMNAYQAPFPDERFMSGVLSFPELVPTPTTDPTGRPQYEGGEENRAAWSIFMQWNKPVLLAFAPEDPVLGSAHCIWTEKCPACRSSKNIDMIGGGHFVQDGCGHQLSKEIMNFVNDNPVSDDLKTRYVISKG